MRRTQFKLSPYERHQTQLALQRGDRRENEERDEKQRRSESEGRYEQRLVEQAYRIAGTQRDGPGPQLKAEAEARALASLRKA